MTRHIKISSITIYVSFILLLGCSASYADDKSEGANTLSGIPKIVLDIYEEDLVTHNESINSELKNIFAIERSISESDTDFSFNKQYDRYHLLAISPDFGTKKKHRVDSKGTLNTEAWNG